MYQIERMDEKRRQRNLRDDAGSFGVLEPKQKQPHQLQQHQQQPQQQQNVEAAGQRVSSVLHSSNSTLSNVSVRLIFLASFLESAHSCRSCCCSYHRFAAAVVHSPVGAPSGASRMAAASLLPRGSPLEASFCCSASAIAAGHSAASAALASGQHVCILAREGAEAAARSDAEQGPSHMRAGLSTNLQAARGRDEGAGGSEAAGACRHSRWGRGAGGRGGGPLSSRQ